MFIDEPNHIYIAIPTYDLIEYSDNYSDTLGSLWLFKRDEVPSNNAYLTIDNCQSFKYKTALVGKTADAVNNTNSFVRTRNSCSIKAFEYILEIVRNVINQLQINLELNWIKDSILSSDGNSAKLKITDAKLHVPIVTLSTTDNVNLTKQLSHGFKRSVYWNGYQTNPAKVIKKGKNMYELHNASFEGVKILCVLAYFVAAGADADVDKGIKGNKKYFFPR